MSETVAVGKTFPASAPQPFFQLVSLTPNSAKIGIAGGSLTNGKNTVTIPVGKTVTLMNTADGTKYTIKLVSVQRLAGHQPCPGSTRMRLDPAVTSASAVAGADPGLSRMARN